MAEELILSEAHIRLSIELCILKARAMVCRECRGPVMPFDHQVKDDGTLIAIETVCMVCASKRGWSIVPQMVDFIDDTIKKATERGYVKFRDLDIPRDEEGNCLGLCFGLCKDHGMYENGFVAEIMSSGKKKRKKG